MLIFHRNDHTPHAAGISRLKKGLTPGRYPGVLPGVVDESSVFVSRRAETVENGTPCGITVIQNRSRSGNFEVDHHLWDPALGKFRDRLRKAFRKRSPEKGIDLKIIIHLKQRSARGILRQH